MGDRASPQQIESFATAVRVVEHWLDERIAPAVRSTEARALVQSTRRYLRRCLAKAAEGDMTTDEIAHRRKRLDDVVVVLWDSARRTP